MKERHAEVVVFHRVMWHRFSLRLNKNVTDCPESHCAAIIVALRKAVNILYYQNSRYDQKYDRLTSVIPRKTVVFHRSYRRDSGVTHMKRTNLIHSHTRAKKKHIHSSTRAND